MNALLWTLLAIFVPNAIGFILYFVLREPLPALCGACGAKVARGFSYCPRCGAPAGPTCPSCRRPAQPDWVNCAFCGTKL
jgi:hypothetical protein